jgi:hypothetical protein
LIEKFVAELNRRPDRVRSERKTEALAWLAISGRTIHAIAQSRGFSPDVLRQWLIEEPFRAELEELPEQFAEFADKRLEAESGAPNLGSFGSGAPRDEFLGAAAAVALTERLRSKKARTEPRFWIAVQRLAAESLRAEQKTTDASASEGWVMKRGRNEEQLRLFWLEHGQVWHPLEWLESHARSHLFEFLRTAAIKEQARQEIIKALQDGDESRAERLRAFRAQLATQKGRNRDRVKKWRRRNP